MRRPKVHVWTVIYFILGLIPLLLLFLWAIRDGWFPTKEILLRHPGSDDPFYAFNQLLAVVAGALAVLFGFSAWAVARGQRAPWIWSAALVIVVLGIPWNVLMGIPVLFFWIRDDNKRYYNKRDGRG